MSRERESAGTGVGIGTIIAVILSWQTNHSVLWALLHGFCSWFYVIYWWLEKQP